MLVRPSRPTRPTGCPRGKRSLAGRRFAVLGSLAALLAAAGADLVPAPLARAASTAFNQVDLPNQADWQVLRGRFTLAGVAGGGDVNGDGLDDVAVAGDEFPPGGSTPTATVTVVFGSRSRRRVDPSSITAPDGFRITAGKPGAVWIRGVALGDINGDQRADVVVVVGPASPAVMPSTPPSHVYVVFGSDRPTAISLDTLAPGHGMVMSTRAGEGLGYAAAALDVNGDGRDDIAVPDPWHQAVRVVLGQAVPADVPDLDALEPARGYSISVPAGGGPRVVSDGGDLNRDGRDDLLVGGNSGSGEGAVWAVFGAAVPADVALSALPATGGYRIDGANGNAATGAGDLDGDGRPDVLATFSGGTAAVGTPAGSAIDLLGLRPPAGFIVGRPPAAAPGYSAAGPGDIDGDGLADLQAGLIRGSGRGERAREASILVYGNRAPSSRPLDVLAMGPSRGFRLLARSAADLPAAGNDDPGDEAGAFLARAGDVNGDGLADLLLGAPGGGEYLGPTGAYVVFGQRRNAVAEVTGFRARRSSVRAGAPTAFEFSLSLPAQVRIELRRPRRPGVRTIIRLRWPGHNAIPFDGRIAGRRLPPGRWQATAYAVTRAGRRGPSQAGRITIR